VGRVRMRIGLARAAVRRPARVADAARAVERLALQSRFEIAQLAFRAPAREMATFERGDAGRVIAAVFEPLERVDELCRHRLASENADNAAHAAVAPLLQSG